MIKLTAIQKAEIYTQAYLAALQGAASRISSAEDTESYAHEVAISAIERCQLTEFVDDK